MNMVKGGGVTILVVVVRTGPDASQRPQYTRLDGGKQRSGELGQRPWADDLAISKQFRPRPGRSL